MRILKKFYFTILVTFKITIYLIRVLLGMIHSVIFNEFGVMIPMLSLTFTFSWLFHEYVVPEEYKLGNLVNIFDGKPPDFIPSVLVAMAIPYVMIGLHVITWIIFRIIDKFLRVVAVKPWRGKYGYEGWRKKVYWY